MNELIAKSAITSEQHNPYGAQGCISVKNTETTFEFEIKIWDEKNRYIRITREGKLFFFELTSDPHPSVTNIDSLSYSQELLAEILTAVIIKNIEISMEDTGGTDLHQNKEGAISSVDVDILPADEELRLTLINALGHPQPKFIM